MNGLSLKDSLLWCVIPWTNRNVFFINTLEGIIYMATYEWVVLIVMFPLSYWDAHLNCARRTCWIKTVVHLNNDISKYLNQIDPLWLWYFWYFFFFNRNDSSCFTSMLRILNTETRGQSFNIKCLICIKS